MKKLMTLMLGLCLTFGTAAVFAQDNPPTKESTAKKKKGSGKKKGAEPKKDEKK